MLPLQRFRAWSWVLCGCIYSFSLVSYSHPLSAGVLHSLICLKVYSWCTHEERYTPCPPTPPPSCSPSESLSSPLTLFGFLLPGEWGAGPKKVWELPDCLFCDSSVSYRLQEAGLSGPRCDILGRCMTRLAAGVHLHCNPFAGEHTR